MALSSLRSLTTSVKHHDRALTLVFGSDGQVSLIGFDSGVASQAPYTLTVSNVGTPMPGIRSLTGGSSSVSPVPNLEATTPSLTGIASQTPTPTSVSSSTSILSSATSSYDPSSNATDTDTNLPSIPTVNYPTPSPTPVSNPRDHGVGAPFYLAIVLASISFIGCVAALIAWWIRSRTRKHDLEVDDVWSRSDTISDTGIPSIGNANGSEKENQTRVETQTQPYHLPASTVRGNSNLLAVPHTIPNLKGGTSLSGTSHRANDPRSHNSNPYQNTSSPRTKDSYSRPGTERLQSVLSVQESTRTLGRLRVANRVPGDVTSGDEGGTSMPRSQNNAGLSSVPIPNVDVAPGENAIPHTRYGQGDRPLDTPLEPPGPATIPWGRRTDTVAALRRTQRQTPGMTARPYKNPGHSGYPYPVLEGGSMWQVPVATNQDENKDRGNSPSELLDWKSTLKSSFWQAVDTMTGNRPTDPGSQPANTGSGSGFTPAPQRVAARRSPVSPTRPSTNSAELAPLDNLFAVQETPQNSAHSSPGSSATRKDDARVPQISELAIESVGSPPPRVSHLNRNLGVATRRPPPDSTKADTGSVYSTDSAAARANLRKYGYEDPIPSSWSALGTARESQLDLERLYLPLPNLIPSPSPSPLLTTPSQLTLGSSFLPSSVSTRAPIQPNLDASMLWSDKTVNLARYGETKSPIYSTSMSRNGTIQSGLSTASHGTVPLPHAPSATSNTLNRKKGVTTRRKRPIPQRAPSSASSVQSIESGLSIREVAVRRALLERRQKVKAANSLKGRNDILTRNHDAGSSLGNDPSTVG